MILIPLIYQYGHVLDKMNKVYLVHIEEEISKCNLAVCELDMPVSISFTHEQQSLLNKNLGVKCTSG